MDRPFFSMSSGIPLFYAPRQGETMPAAELLCQGFVKIAESAALGAMGGPEFKLQARMGLLAKAFCSGGRVKLQARMGLLAKAFRSGGRVKPRPYGWLAEFMRFCWIGKRDLGFGKGSWGEFRNFKENAKLDINT